MADDPQLRELSADPRHRRVLITDARTATGQAMVEAFLEAGAALVFAGIAEPWKPLSATKRLAARADVEIVQRGQTHGSDPAWLAAPAGVEIVPLDVTDTESIADLASAIAHRVDILVNTAEHVRPGGLLDRAGLAVAREEMDAGYLGLVRLAQAFGPVLRARGADGVNSAAAWVNLISAYALMTWPPYGGYSAAQAAMLSGAISLRSELRAGGIRVVNVFAGPLDTEWFQTLPPPKVAPGAVARATVAALRRGQEDVFVGDIANDIRARLAANAKALERELGA
jgi:NAD(P)-dependent dehydrogenase (short-subunit alcohol dehydrogenase family)